MTGGRSRPLTSQVEMRGASSSVLDLDADVSMGAAKSSVTASGARVRRDTRERRVLRVGMVLD